MTRPRSRAGPWLVSKSGSSLEKGRSSLDARAGRVRGYDNIKGMAVYFDVDRDRQKLVCVSFAAFPIGANVKVCGSFASQKEH